MACVGDFRNAGGAGRKPCEEAADRHVAVNQVRALAAKQPDEGAECPVLCKWRDPTDEGRWLYAKAFGADICE